MSALIYITQLWRNIGIVFKIIADYAERLPFVGDNLYAWFMIAGNWFYDGTDDFSPSESCLYSRTLEFNTWVRYAGDRLEDILTLRDIENALFGYLAAALNAWAWVADSVSNVTAIANTWWNTTRLTVQGWIDEARQFLQDQVDQVSTLQSNLQEAWDDFSSRIPTLDEVIRWWNDWPGNVRAEITTWWTSTMGEVQGLIDSSISTWFPFYDDLVSSWDDIKEFFTDPWGYLIGKFTDWFMGPEV